MQNFTTVLKAEHIKKKGTGIYVTSIVLGAFSPIVYAIAQIIENNVQGGDTISYNYYMANIEELLEAFSEFFFPLLIIITVSRITQLDHKNGGWQLMETQPVRKTSIYFSKFTVILISNLIAILSLITFSYIGAWVTGQAIGIPKAATTDFLPGAILGIIARLFLAGLTLSALQYLLSVLIPSFVWSVLIGFFLLLGYLFLKAFNLVPDWYPIAFLGKTSQYPKGSELGYWITYSETAATLFALILLYIGFKWYKYKTVNNAFFNSGKKLVSLTGVLIIVGGLIAYTLTTNQSSNYTATIISGRLDTKETFNYIYIRDRFVNDTIAAIPLVNNTFHYRIKQVLPLDNYQFILDDALTGNVFFGANDSVYLDIKKYKAAIKGKVTGTRLAENQYKEEEKTEWSEVAYLLNENQLIDNVPLFSEKLVKEWDEAMGESSRFKTVDNYVPRPDFVEKTKKVLTIKYLNYWITYLKKRKAMFPKKGTQESPEIIAMKNTVPLNDDSLLSDENYFNYVKSQLIAGNKANVDEDTKSVQAISKLKPGIFRDKMLYWQLKKTLGDPSDKKERDSLLAQYAYTFKDKKYATLVLKINKTVENLTKGKQATAIAATTLDNKPFSLEQYKGKVIAIDVWATWCGPCREESPYFDKLAIKYKDAPIQFVALSTDRRIEDWYVEAKLKLGEVLQVHSSNDKAFSQAYDIQYIPRFILIDAAGNIINSKMPRPSESNFEDIIRQALNLPEQR